MTSFTISQLQKELDEWSIESANEFIDDLYDGVRNKTPVRTGTAKAGWEKDHLTKLGDDGGVYNDVEYVKYLEDGTVHMAPVHMVKRTLSELRNKK